MDLPPGPGVGPGTSGVVAGPGAAGIGDGDVLPTTVPDDVPLLIAVWDPEWDALLLALLVWDAVPVAVLVCVAVLV